MIKLSMIPYRPHGADLKVYVLVILQNNLASVNQKGESLFVLKLFYYELSLVYCVHSYLLISVNFILSVKGILTKKGPGFPL
ncbi:hypothetical protein SCFA_430009 [anaerobic digester metagenome]|uniref:Uncharacterized protein n=1 Tax=anaerobic digester metagenome TaxID=1263854 RepID=A0A485MBI1_9ZZZZ